MSQEDGYDLPLKKSPSTMPDEIKDSKSNDARGTLIINPSHHPAGNDLANQPVLEVVTGEANLKLLRLVTEKAKIGRSGYNDLMLIDGKVSRSHAEVYFEDGRYVVKDLNSTNGVLVNGQSVSKIPLKSGDRITIGDTVLLFSQKDPEISLQEKEVFIERSDLFNWLDKETMQLLARNLVVRFFPHDATVQRQNTPVESMFFVYSGEIRIVDINEEGGERSIDTLRPGDFFGERAILAGESGNYSMIATSDSNLLELRKERLNELLQQKPDLNQAFYRMVLTKLRSAQIESGEKGERRDNLKNIITSTDVEIVGQDKKILEAKKKVQNLAAEEKAAFIIGPPGTGKKAFARYFHKVSAHPDYPYVEISMADLEESQAGASLFGIETDPGATHMKGQIGYLEMIGMGTLAIAHAELLDAHQQSKLVTYLKHGWFHRVYGQESVRTDTRIIFLASGTEAEVLDKFIPELREELKKRMIVLPSLMQRLKDIPILADYYLKLFSRANGKRINALSKEATDKLVSYTWPGNVKELENVIQRAAMVSSDDVIIPGDLIFVLPSEKEIHKINLLHMDKFRNILQHPLIPGFFIWFNVIVVLIIAGLTLYGGSRPQGHPLQSFDNNPGMLITWLIWFPVLPISAFLLGRIWCGICPIAGMGDMAARIKKFNMPVPKILQRLDFWLVVVAFIFLDYFEEYFGVADKPWATGMLLVVIITLSVLFCVMFERKTFCRYLCPLAGMVGTYATMSVVEIRGNKKVCQTQCGQHSCYKDTEQALGCPMFSYPASISSSTECMMCMNCLKSCEHRGVQVNLRPPLQELWSQSKPMLSLSLFGVMLVGLMARHQFPSLTYWLTKEQALGLSAGLIHPLLFFFFLGAVLIPFALSSTLSAAASQEKIQENMAHYGMAFIPLALAGHISHVSHEFFSEGIYLLSGYAVKLYYSIARGIPIVSSEVVVPHFIHGSIVTFLKLMFVAGGMLASIFALVMIANRLSKNNVFARILPHLLVLFLFGAGYLFIFTGSTDAPPAAATPVASTLSTPSSLGLLPQSGPGRPVAR